MPTIDPKDLETKILENQELVEKIRESANNLSTPMSVEEFKAWLDKSEG